MRHPRNPAGNPDRASCGSPAGHASSHSNPPLPHSLTPEPSSPTPAVKATQTPAPQPTLDILSTLIAKGPSIEVTFDSTGCTVAGSPELPAGEHVIVLYNDSGESAYLFPARHYPGKTWQEILQDIGTPGSTDAQAKDIVLLPWDYFETADERVSYRQYDFSSEGEYHIVVEGQGKYHGIWPCGPFQVVPAP